MISLQDARIVNTHAWKLVELHPLSAQPVTYRTSTASTCQIPIGTGVRQNVLSAALWIYFIGCHQVALIAPGKGL